MSTKFTVLLGIAACQASFQALVAVAIFVLFAIKYTLSFWMIAAVIFVYHGGSSLLEKSLGVKDWARCVHRLEHESMEHRVRDPDTLGSLLRPLCKDRAIVRDHSGNFVYNTPKLVSVHPEPTFLDVILRSPADGGTTKNLEILRCAQDDKASLSSRSLS